MPETIEQLTARADTGDVTAKHELGRKYFNAEEVAEDKEKAFLYWQQAAEKGYAPSQCYLGECYHDGDGVKKNANKAFAWSYIASKAGNERATENLEEWEENPAYRTAWFNAARVPNGKAALEALNTDGHIAGEEQINSESKTHKATALHLAAQNNCVANLKYLLSLGAALDVKTSETKKTPLHEAAKAGHWRCTYWLVKSGADVNTAGHAPHGISRLIDQMVKRQEDAELLQKATQDNLRKEIIPRDGALYQFTQDISLLEKHAEEIKYKSNNNEWHKNSTPTKIKDIIAEFRQQHAVEKPDDYPAWIEEKRQERITELRQQYSNRLAELEAIATQHQHLAPPLQWGMPRVISTPSGIQDDFVYPGSTPEKTVHVPYTALHKQLIDSNWLMRAGNNPSQNYLLAHMVFIVSSAPHVKTHDAATGETHYAGGRTFIDFPIIGSLDALTQKQDFATQEAFDSFLGDEGISSLGTYRAASSGQHSEYGLATFLKNPSNVQKMVSVLKSKLATQYGTGEGFKLYAVDLFVNSQKNVCGGGIKADHSRLMGCENLLQQLMTSTTPDSFLHHMKEKATASGIQLPTKNDGYPRMTITVSAGELYTSHTSDGSYCSDRLGTEARQALSSYDENPIPKTRLKLAYDTKALSGKVILSTSEQWVDRLDDEERKEHVLTQLNSGSATIPAYTGFRSASGSNYHLSKWQDTLTQATPVCQDGIEIWKVSNGTAGVGK